MKQFDLNVNTFLLLLVLGSVWFTHLRPSKPQQQGEYKLSDIRPTPVDLSAGFVPKSDPWLVGRFQKYEDGLLFDTESGRVCLPNSRNSLTDGVFLIGTARIEQTLSRYKKGELPGCADLTSLRLEAAREQKAKLPPGFTLDPPDQWKVVSDKSKATASSAPPSNSK